MGEVIPFPRKPAPTPQPPASADLERAAWMALCRKVLMECDALRLNLDSKEGKP